ncbi:TonB-dependent receptor [Sphingobium sp. ZW T5_29]|uniref:TonB-dependent receptor n=1 Tax=Sphingobium sp. ZW T5_29 TaxID=3378077 RepID=UPI003852949E
MMKFQASKIAVTLSGAALWALATAAAAQTDNTSGTAGAEGPGVSDIVVTATRRSENVQDIPVTVTAISGAQLENLQIKQFSDIQILSPGLSFENRGAQGNVTSMRGISSTVTTSAPAAVVIYFNEVPVNDFVAFQSIYDVGQIEVLRGPQGTLRGVAAPVGSITIGTRRPDLNEIGGTVIGTVTDQPNYNGQFAVNFPIVNDKLAVRFAGLMDQNTNGYLKNKRTGAESRIDTMSMRASLLFKPIETLSIFASYQYLHNESDTLERVEGPGLGYNGPVISSGRKDIAVQERATPREFTSHVASVNARLELGDEAAINYVGGYTQFKSLTRLQEGDTDVGNAVLNYSAPQLFSVDTHSWSHELRVDSSGPGRFLDYAFGVFYQKGSPDQVTNVGANGGAIGYASLNPPTGPATLLGNDILLPETRVEKSAFASATIHLPTRTDITVGARRLQFKRDQGFILTQTTNGIPNTPTPLLNESSSRKFNEWVFDARVVQHLDDDKMVYFSYGRGFRGPGANRAVPIPLIAALQTLPAEKSNAYEVGFKGDFFDRRVRFNFDVFQQDFKGFNAVAGDVPYCPFYAPPQVICQFGLAQSGQIVFGGDARVRGFEAELSANISDRWMLSGNVSYANAKFKNALVPYRPDLNGDGIPDTNAEFGAGATESIYFARSNGPISDVPKWNFTVQSEYNHPIGNEAQAYVRGLFTYKGKRADVSGANSYAAEPIMNLYVGVREWIPGLDITVFARNLFDTRKRTFLGAPINFGELPTGYSSVNYTAPREVGLTARFAFGGG